MINRQHLIRDRVIDKEYRIEHPKGVVLEVRCLNRA